MIPEPSLFVQYANRGSPNTRKKIWAVTVSLLCCWFVVIGWEASAERCCMQKWELWVG